MIPLNFTFYQIARIFQKIDESVVIRKIKRKFKKPHGGYRLFNNSKFTKCFPKYKMESIKKNIYEMTKNRNVRN